MLDDHTFGVHDAEDRVGWGRWVNRWQPALVAAAWFWVFFFILALITLFTGWASLIVTLALQSLTSLGAGAVAARRLHQLERPNPRYTQMGAFAGFFLVLTTFAVVILVALWVGLSSFGAALPLMIPYFLNIPTALILCGGFGAIGARLMQSRLARKDNADD